MEGNMQKYLNNEVIGNVRTGTRGEKDNPVKLAYFDVHTDNSTSELAVEIFNEKYKQPNSLVIKFINQQPMEVGFQRYEGKKLKCYGNSKEAREMDDKGKRQTITCNPNECPYRQKKKCKMVGRLYFIIKKLEDEGVWCYPMGSEKGIRNIWRRIARANRIGKDLTNDWYELYLRPETAQGIFVNFKNVLRTTRRKMPMGIAQIGKSFRNEITPGNFTFRTREFEQMELEFFCKPGTDLEWHAYWKDYCKDWLLNLGIKPENIRLRDHEQAELSHYSNATTDIEFLFPFGWGELWGIADRTNFDLKQHMEYSKEDMTYLDPETNERYVPYCIEPSLGCDRVALAFLCNSYEEEEVGEGDTRIVLHLHPAIAPYKVAILPLSKKLSDKASDLYADLSKSFMCDYDEAGSIGKRYRREDEIGTPYCITVDFETENDGCVTVRDRDTMQQERIKIEDIKEYINSKLEF